MFSKYFGKLTIALFGILVLLAFMPAAASAGDVIVHDGDTIIIDFLDGTRYIVDDNATATFAGPANTLANTSIVCGTDVYLIIQGVKIDLNGLDFWDSVPVIEFTGGNNTLEVSSMGGNSNLAAGIQRSGIYVPDGTSLEIVGSGGLTVSGHNSGIGGYYDSAATASCGNITINMTGWLDATGGTDGISRGSGIGSFEDGSCGTISILSGTVTASGGYLSPGIGAGPGGYFDTGASIDIQGGSVYAYGGESGAGIGAGSNVTEVNINISGGYVEAKGGINGTFAGAGIGTGHYSASGGADPSSIITINGTAIVFAESQHTSARDIGDGSGVTVMSFTDLVIGGQAMVFYKNDRYSSELTLGVDHAHGTYPISGGEVLGITVPSGWSTSTSGHTYQVTMTFDRNYTSGGTFTDTTTKGDLVAKPTNPTRAGYTFGGWYTNSGCSVGNDWDFPNDTVNSSMSLYAKWTAKSNTLTYNGNGFTSGSMADESHTTDSVFNLTANAYSRTDYSFLGWDTASGASTPAYADGASFTMPVGNEVLYAVWNKLPNRISSVSATDTETVVINTPYTVDLSAIFEDADGDTLTYKVSIDSGADIAAAESYSYTPTTSGDTVLRFIANDGHADSTDTYTVTLTANTIPNRISSVPTTDTETVEVNAAYTVDLSTIFEDADGDTLTYKVSIDSGADTAANESYSYTPTTDGDTVLRFIANDGHADSTDTYTVTVTAVYSVQSIDFDNAYATVGVGTSDSAENICTFTFTPSNATNQAVTWHSSDTSVASISGGVLTAHKVGRTVITVTSADTTNGTIKDTMTLEVINASPDDPNAYRGDIYCTLTDYQDNKMQGYYATLYSTPVTVITDVNGEFSFSNATYDNHTLVISNSLDEEVGRFSLIFTSGSPVGISVNNGAHIANITYDANTESIELTLQMDPGQTQVQIFDSSINQRAVVPNPHTGDSPNYGARIFFFIGTVIAAGLILNKKKIFKKLHNN